MTLLSAAERDVSMVFQSYALFPHMTVLENVCYGLRASGMRKAQAVRAGAGEAGAGRACAGYGARLPSELSGGQQQRVAVARAIVLEPKVLLFDEPLSNLDAKLRRRVREEIRELQQSLSLTAVYVTHDQQEALAISDRIMVMSMARIAQDGTPRELYEQPATRFVADFIGDANIVPVTIARLSPTLATVTVADRLTLDLPHRDMPDGAAELAVRPQAIRVARGERRRRRARAAPCGRPPISAATWSTRSAMDGVPGDMFVLDGGVDRPLAPGDRVTRRDRGVRRGAGSEGLSEADERKSIAIPMSTAITERASRPGSRTPAR